MLETSQHGEEDNAYWKGKKEKERKEEEELTP